VNYDIPTAAFGEIAAQDDARERAAETMAQRFRAELALRMAQARQARGAVNEDQRRLDPALPRQAGQSCPRCSALRSERKLHPRSGAKACRLGVGKSDDPYAVTKLGEDEIKKDARAWPMRWRRNHCWAGRRSCGRGSAAKARTSDPRCFGGFERGEPMAI
jgi:hypothetical protein